MLVPLVRRAFVPCLVLGLAGSATAESAIAPDVPGQQFPDRGYVDDPDTGPSGGVDIGPPPLPPPDSGPDTGVPPIPDVLVPRDEAGPGSVIDSGSTLDAGVPTDVGAGDVFLGPPELPMEEPSSCHALGPSGGATWAAGLLLGVLALAVRARRGARGGGARGLRG